VKISNFAPHIEKINKFEVNNSDFVVTNYYELVTNFLVWFDLEILNLGNPDLGVKT